MTCAVADSGEVNYENPQNWLACGPAVASEIFAATLTMPAPDTQMCIRALSTRDGVDSDGNPELASTLSTNQGIATRAQPQQAPPVPTVVKEATAFDVTVSVAPGTADWCCINRVLDGGPISNLCHNAAQEPVRTTDVSQGIDVVGECGKILQVAATCGNSGGTTPSADQLILSMPTCPVSAPNAPSLVP